MRKLGLGGHGPSYVPPVTPRDARGHAEAEAALLRSERALQAVQARQPAIDRQAAEVARVSSAHRELLERNHFGEAIRDSFGLRK